MNLYKYCTLQHSLFVGGGGGRRERPSYSSTTEVFLAQSRTAMHPTLIFHCIRYGIAYYASL